MQGNYQGAFENLKRNTNEVAERLGSLIGELKQASVSLRLATAEILSGSNDLAQRTNRQAGTVDEIGKAMIEFNAQVEASGQRARAASEIAEVVAATATEGGKVAEGANQAMARIASPSAIRFRIGRRIGKPTRARAFWGRRAGQRSEGCVVGTARRAEEPLWMDSSRGRAKSGCSGYRAAPAAVASRLPPLVDFRSQHRVRLGRPDRTSFMGFWIVRRRQKPNRWRRLNPATLGTKVGSWPGQPSSKLSCDRVAMR